METLVKALGPVFVASFALQQLLELLDPALELLISKHKAWILSATALVVGLLLTVLLNLRVLSVFGVSRFARRAELTHSSATAAVVSIS